MIKNFGYDDVGFFVFVVMIFFAVGYFFGNATGIRDAGQQMMPAIMSQATEIQGLHQDLFNCKSSLSAPRIDDFVWETHTITLVNVTAGHWVHIGERRCEDDPSKDCLYVME